jgi:tRNA threonylcarbamoyladenosine biosynthesis protein TsaE
MHEIVSTDLNLMPVINYLVDELKERKIILVTGDLGAGKTTTIKKLVAQLGSKDEVNSPTFSLINEYEYPDGYIYHMDMYRLNDIDEAIEIGIEEYLDSKEICIIEWPELIESLIVDAAIRVTIKVNDDNSRTFFID